jgi:hypothetical protein
MLSDKLDDDNLINKLKNWLSHLKLERFMDNFYSNGYHSIDLLFMQMNSK